jgi:hypothetical protein
MLFWRSSFRNLGTGLAVTVLALGCGCGDNGRLPALAETNEAKYIYAERMLRETRPDDALAAFLEVIKERPDDAPESHLEAGRILLNVKNDPVEAIHHFREYLAMRPNAEQAPMVAQMIETAKKQFARSLPGNKGAYDEVDLLDQISTLKSDNDNLRRQLGLQPQRLTGVSLQNQTTAVVAAPPPPGPPPPTVRVNPAPPTPTRVTTALPPPSAAAVTAAPPARTYSVQSGDTLSSISMKIYGVRSRYIEIYNANTDQLSSPNAMLHPGQILKLPQ